ncbi:MAG: hypothetical protein WB561_19575 [Terracidiphilus sp.]
MNDLREVVFKSLYGGERNIDKPMFVTSFHQLGDAAAVIDVHDDEPAFLPVHANNLSQRRDLSGNAIRFNNNAGNVGTH